MYQCFAIQSLKAFTVCYLVMFHTQLWCDLTITSQKDAHIVLLLLTLSTGIGLKHKAPIQLPVYDSLKCSLASDHTVRGLNHTLGLQACPSALTLQLEAPPVA